MGAAGAPRHRQLLGLLCRQGILDFDNKRGKGPSSGGPGQVEAVRGNVCEGEGAQLWLSLWGRKEHR